MNAQQNGNGNGAPFQGQGNYQSHHQGNNGSGHRNQSNRQSATRCTRCGSQDHTREACPSPNEKCFNCNNFGHRASNCNNPKSPNPNRRSGGHSNSNQNAMTGVNLIQPAFQQIAPAFHQIQQSNMLTMPQQIFQQTQPAQVTHPGVQCQNCGTVGHISGTCPQRLR